MKQIKTSTEKPPHFWIMEKVFKCDWNRTAFAFGDTIYSKYTLPDHLIAHEKTHLEQQCHSFMVAWVWLLLYLVSKKFRYAVELKAYQKQYQFFCEHYTFNDREPFVRKLASDLASPLYGNITSFSGAIRAIKYGEK